MCICLFYLWPNSLRFARWLRNLWPDGRVSIVVADDVEMLFSIRFSPGRGKPLPCRCRPVGRRRYIHVADVRPGMTGYGLTVFHGAKIEKFDVEVVDVVHEHGQPQIRRGPDLLQGRRCSITSVRWRG